MKETARMKHFVFSILLILSLFFHFNVNFVERASAQTNPSEVVTGEIILSNTEASDSASATAAGEIASDSAEIIEKIQEKKDQDLTDTGGKQIGELTAYLYQNPPEPLSWNNFLQHAIFNTVKEGVPANIIVVVILFPVVASLIAASRHVIGLKGFGIYIPAVLSVAFVSTGVIPGLLMFMAISGTAFITSRLLKQTNLPYLPRTALLLWTISIGIIGLLILAPILKVTQLMSVNIFPILILVLLSENFLDAQAHSKESQALALTVETIILAIVASVLFKWGTLQRIALSEPELLLFLTAVVNIIIGKFSGLRVSERLRFGAIIEEE
ncbi:MAG TPA: 7TM domain-containing protein [Candidatus Woesebacteria bacterium]|jgi:hypothetical protein|nr:7TM domain-containing protein [Candidatus Woesebacteria bacterium]HNS65599.1 7TM domain-containing protein [Candidatus Woesebacteria bacterium]